MADNYLEQRMEDLKSGRLRPSAPATSPSGTGKGISGWHSPRGECWSQGEPTESGSP